MLQIFHFITLAAGAFFIFVLQMLCEWRMVFPSTEINECILFFCFSSIVSRFFFLSFSIFDHYVSRKYPFSCRGIVYIFCSCLFLRLWTIGVVWRRSFAFFGVLILRVFFGALKSPSNSNWRLKFPRVCVCVCASLLFVTWLKYYKYQSKVIFHFIRRWLTWKANKI